MGVCCSVPDDSAARGKRIDQSFNLYPGDPKAYEDEFTTTIGISFQKNALLKSKTPSYVDDENGMTQSGPTIDVLDEGLTMVTPTKEYNVPVPKFSKTDVLRMDKDLNTIRTVLSEAFQTFY